MSSIQRMIGITLAVLSSCTPQPEFKEIKFPPYQYAVPLLRVSSPPEELDPDCQDEVILCNYYSDYGTVFVFKCENSQRKTRISTSEKNIFGEKLWYHTPFSQNLNNQTFSEFCKS